MHCFFFFRHPNFSPNIDNIYTIFGLSRKIRIPVKKITAIAVGEEVEKKKYKTRNVSVNTTKQISNSSNRPSIAYLWQMKMELIFKIIIAFIFNPPSEHFIFIAGKGDWEDGSNNITCICVRKPLLMYLLLSPDCVGFLKS